MAAGWPSRSPPTTTHLACMCAPCPTAAACSALRPPAARLSCPPALAGQPQPLADHRHPAGSRAQVAPDQVGGTSQRTRAEGAHLPPAPVAPPTHVLFDRTPRREALELAGVQSKRVRAEMALRERASQQRLYRGPAAAAAAPEGCSQVAAPACAAAEPAAGADGAAAPGSPGGCLTGPAEEPERGSAAWCAAQRAYEDAHMGRFERIMPPDDPALVRQRSGGAPSCGITCDIHMRRSCSMPPSLPQPPSKEVFLPPPHTTTHSTPARRRRSTTSYWQAPLQPFTHQPCRAATCASWKLSSEALFSAGLLGAGCECREGRAEFVWLPDSQRLRWRSPRRPCCAGSGGSRRRRRRRRGRWRSSGARRSCGRGWQTSAISTGWSRRCAPLPLQQTRVPPPTAGRTAAQQMPRWCCSSTCIPRTSCCQRILRRGAAAPASTRGPCMWRTEHSRGRLQLAHGHAAQACA